MLHRSNPRKAFTSFALGLLVLLLGIVATGFAQNVQPKAATAAKPAAPAASGMQAAIDPATLKLRQPTAEEARALAAQMTASRSTKALTAVKHSNGSKSVVLDDRFMETMVARVNADGSVSRACVKTPAEAETFLTSNPTQTKTQPAVAPAEEEQ